MEGKNTKKILMFCLTLALLLGISTNALADITVIVVPINNSEEVEKLFVSWKEQFDFGITYEVEPGYSDTVNKLTTMMASGDDSIDVMWIDEIMQLAFTRAGFLEPLYCD